MNYCYQRNEGQPFPPYRPAIHKLLLITKLLFICTIISIQVTAATYAQKITLHYENAPLRDVLQSIRKQTGYYFFFASEYLEKATPVSVSLTNATLETTLSTVFKGQPFEYAIKGKMITVRPAPPSTVDKVANFFSVITVRGKVTDEEGNPLPGVTVILKEESGKMAVTDQHGNFLFDGVPDKGTLVVRMIGRETKEVGYTTEKQLKIILKETDANLKEIQVVAYGTVRKEFNTSNVSVISARDIQNQPVTNVQLALSGRVPGLFIKQGSGISASSVDVTVQGKNSIGNGNEPFYVIDGIPYTAQFTNASLMEGAIAGLSGSALNLINPADIESISVLKDADATAIYGSRAANGAILITTKKGKAGKTQLDINIQNGWGRISKMYDLLTPEEYLTIRKEQYINDGQPIPTLGSEVNWTNYDLSVWSPNKYNDWQKQLVGGTAMLTNIQASLSGGNANTQFLTSYGYIRETTVYPNKLSNKRGNVHFNLNHSSSNNKFKYTLSATYLQGINTLNDEDLMRSAIILAPNAPDMYNADGSINWAPAPQNPGFYTHTVNPAVYIGKPFEGKTNNLLANNNIGYEVVPGLIIKGSFGINRINGEETKLSPLTLFRPDNPDKIRSARFLSKSVNSWIAEPQITYNKVTNFGVLDLLIGGTVQQTNSNILQQIGSGHSSDAQLKNIAAAPQLDVDINVASKYKYNALFGRLNYRLRDKYILNLTARRDGSSRFGPENKLHNFYGIGGAWLFGKEEIINSDLPWLSFGKIKINYGTTGNDQISDYRYLSLLNNYYTNIPYLGTSGIYPTNISNPYLQWEETHKFNLGLEMGFLEDKLFLTANYFRNRSSNQLLLEDLPATTGFGNIDRNFPAVVQNTGIEMQLNAKVISNSRFNWRSSVNITLPNNKLISFPNLENSTYADRMVVGKSFSLAKVYKYMGVNTNTGLYEFMGADGKPTSNPSPFTDRTELIDMNPRFYGGFNNTFEYARFTLDVLFQFTSQNGIADRFGNYAGYVNSNQQRYILDRWQKAGDVASIQKISLSGDAIVAYDAALNSDKSFSDASYIRLKNFALSYTISEKLMRKFNISRTRIFIQGQNLWTYTKYIGLDPETQATGSIPPLRMVNAGFQLTF
ncbi:SusC/RagA family TonB-linked outer membrane protein [Chitinophaga rhizophila]|uniref:SusC/RagA family TonB-linked outer membrane protein n=1 Tax=Chitinophaga rhizophila TaxID=2866212 RepID=A0ABS7G937_9BACT|nr:SusC/RagA family TonB-linked outer membrane protein [Chitinophaga rhizophila]MBW8683038.1 SusC/RagA family TonB-linked outer membrane protein [Chitinophaga rhizophila]